MAYSGVGWCCVVFSAGCGFIGYETVDGNARHSDTTSQESSTVAAGSPVAEELTSSHSAAEPQSQEVALIDPDHCAEHPDAFACASFVEGDPLVLEPIVGTGAILRTTQEGFSGSGIEVFSTSEEDVYKSANITLRFSPVTEESDLYARFWFWKSSDTFITNFSEHLAFHSNGGNPKHASFDLQDGMKFAVYLNPENADARSRRSAPGVTMPSEEWVCIQLELRLRQPGSARLLVNGVEEAREPESDIDLRFQEPIERISFGAAVVGDTDSFHYKLDELVIAHVPVPCTL